VQHRASASIKDVDALAKNLADFAYVSSVAKCLVSLSEGRMSSQAPTPQKKKHTRNDNQSALMERLTPLLCLCENSKVSVKEVYDWLENQQSAADTQGHQRLKLNSVGNAMAKIVAKLNNSSSSDAVTARHTSQLDAKQSGYTGLKFNPPHLKNKRLPQSKHKLH